MKSIEKTIRKTGLFSNLDDEKLKQLLEKVNLVTISATEVLFYEGQRADSLFIILDGTAEVFCLDDFKNEIILARLGRGDFFGEQSLISITPGIRNASVRAITDINAIEIDHQTYLVFENPDNTVEEKLRQIGFEQLLVKLSKRSLELDFAKYFFDPERKYENREYQPNETIIIEGEEADGLYFLQSGNVEIYKKNNSNEDSLVCLLTSGSVFGELGVLTKQPRIATAKSRGRVQVIFMSDKEFLLAYQNKHELKEIADLPKHIYETESGEVEQITGSFLGMHALISHFYLKDGNHFVASWVEGTTMRTIINPQMESTQLVTFIKDRIYRQLHLNNGILIGVTCFGLWNGLDELYKRVFENSPISIESLEYFSTFGVLKELPAISEDFFCNCLCQRKSDVAKYLAEGVRDINTLTNKTGIGTICGACLQKNNG